MVKVDEHTAWLLEVDRRRSFCVCPLCRTDFKRAEVAARMWPNMPKGRPKRWVCPECDWECGDYAASPISILINRAGGVVVR